MTPAELKALILATPAAATLYAAGNDVGTAAVLNAPADPEATCPRDVPVGEFVNLLYDLGLWSTITAAAANAQLPQQLRDTCTRVMRLEQSPHFERVQHQRVPPLVGAFLVAGLVDQPQADAIAALFAEPDLTPLAACTADDVYRTRADQ